MEKGKETKWPDKRKSSWRDAIVLTKPEGEAMERSSQNLLPKHMPVLQENRKDELVIYDEPYL